MTRMKAVKMKMEIVSTRKALTIRQVPHLKSQNLTRQKKKLMTVNEL